MATKRGGRAKGSPKTEGSGRAKGTPNKATGEMRELAKEHGAKVIAGLMEIFQKSESDPARVSAGREILDRGYGRAPQAVTGEAGGEPITIKHIVTWLK